MKLFFLGPRIFGIRPGLIARPRELFPARVLGAPEQTTGSFLYVIRGTHGLVKIGMTMDPQARLAALQTGSPFPLELIYIAAVPDDAGYAVEQAAHALLEQSRVSGEWFSCRPDRASQAVEQAAASLGIPLLRTPPELVERILSVTQATLAYPPLKLPYGLRLILGVLLGCLAAALVQVTLLRGF